MKCLYTIVLFCCMFSLGAAHAWDPAPDTAYMDTGDKSRTPIVFVHGQNGAGDQFERQWMHFTSNGYPPSWVVSFDYDTSVRSGRRPGEMPEGPFESTTTKDLDAFIDAVRKRTGFDKIHLVGHSRGTFESAAYLSDPDRAAKIAKYAAIGGADATNPNGVPSICISGMGDLRPGPSASNGGVVAWMPDYQDHVMVCTSDESFWSLYTFLNDGEKPATLKMVPEERPQIGGYTKSYINNMPLGGATVEVWEVAQETGLREAKKPLVTLTVGETGTWGPFSAEPGQTYEFVIHGTKSTIPPRFFRTAFTRSDMMVYFRIAADAEGYRASPFDGAPQLLNDKNPVYVVRHQNGALVPGVMTLSANGHELIQPPMVEATEGPRQGVTVALYMADGNANGQTDAAILEGFGGPFVNSADFFAEAGPKKSVQFKLNNHVLNVPAIAGAEAGPISVVFEDFR